MSIRFTWREAYRIYKTSNDSSELYKKTMKLYTNTIPTVIIPTSIIWHMGHSFAKSIGNEDSHGDMLRNITISGIYGFGHGIFASVISPIYIPSVAIVSVYTGYSFLKS